VAGVLRGRDDRLHLVGDREAIIYLKGAGAERP